MSWGVVSHVIHSWGQRGYGSTLKGHGATLLFLALGAWYGRGNVWLVL